MRRPSPLVTVPLVVLSGLALSLFAAQAPRDPGSGGLRVLIVNDDGIDSPGLAALVRAFDPHGEVVVAAPTTNRSGSSRSIGLFSGRLAVERRELPGADEAWAVDGTPVDACNFGVVALARDEGFDLVVSGINEGANVGAFVHYSGTIGAAMEGAAHGVPAVAVSMDRGADADAAAAWTVAFARAWLEHDPDPGVVPSIEWPARPAADAAEAVATRLGPAPIRVARWERRRDEDGAEFVVPRFERLTPDELRDDTAAFAAGRVTVTPLLLDHTAEAARAAMEAWLPPLPRPGE